MFVFLNNILNHSVLLAGCLIMTLSTASHGSDKIILGDNENIHSLNGENNSIFSESEIQIDVKQLYPLARQYEYGEGVNQDFEKSLYFLNLAVEQNIAQAMYHLGYKYENGIGVKKDINKAIELYVKAKEENHSDAINQLGKLYENGIDVKQDFEHAAQLYSKAILIDGNFKALNNLGSLFAKGKGVEQDFEKASEYFEKAKKEFSERKNQDENILKIIENNILEMEKDKKNMEDKNNMLEIKENNNRKCIVF